METKMNTELVCDTAVTDGIEMDYCSFGKGDKVFVIIPGLSIKPVTVNGEAIQQGFSIFTEGYKVYLFDRRTNLPDSYTIEDMANDTVKVMQYLGIEKASLFGASQGGMIAQYIALNHPDMVEKMILGSTLSRCNDNIKNVLDQWIQLAREKKGYELNEAISKRLYSQATMEAFGEVLLEAGNDITDEEMDRFVTVASTISDFDIYNDIYKITCNVLVLGCEGDQVTTVEGAREIEEQLHCEAFYYGAEYGHAVFDEAADYRPRMLEFLEK